jgi:hypothetical protein
LNLGADFNVPEDRHKELCALIEEKLHLLNDAIALSEQESDLDVTADSIVKKIIAKESDSQKVVKKGTSHSTQADSDYVSVDLDSLENSDVRSFGGEAVCLDMINHLCLPDKLKEWGFNCKQRALAIGSIVSGLLKPGSERSRFNWLQKASGLGELIDFDYHDSSLSRFYEIADLLYFQKKVLEEWLYQKECRLFTLEESIILYDLTNTFFEGTGKYNSKARFGRSKEKRSSTPLVTMGLVLDGHGFPRKRKPCVDSCW